MSYQELRVVDLMSTALITMTEGDTLDAADLDMKLAGIRHVLVVDDRNHLVGIVSDRDVLREARKGQTKSIPVHSVMSTDIETVDVETTAASAVEILIERKFGCLPVIGEDGQLVGVVTETDFLQIAHGALTGSGGERGVA